MLQVYNMRSPHNYRSVAKCFIYLLKSVYIKFHFIIFYLKFLFTFMGIKPIIWKIWIQADKPDNSFQITWPIWYVSASLIISLFASSRYCHPRGRFPPLLIKGITLALWAIGWNILPHQVDSSW